MKSHHVVVLLALALATPALTATAQNNEPPRNQRPRDGQDLPPPPDGDRPRAQRRDGQGGPGGPGGPAMRSPLIAALDANNDGVIDEKEIDNASKALRKLDKNGDGKLTPEEIRPARPGGPQGGPQGNFNPDGPRPREGQPPGDGQPPRRPQRPVPEGEK